MRPTLLTLLCIATIFWNGINIFTNFKVFSNSENIPEFIAENEEQIFEIYEQQGFTEEQIAPMEEGIEKIKNIEPSNYKYSSILSILSCILLIFGAIRMWDLKKQGFTIYLVGIALGIFASVPFFGGMMLTWTLFTGFIGTILYYSQRKHLTA